MPDLLLEIGTEELPPKDAGAASEQLGRSVQTALDELRLSSGGISVFAAPRRLAVLASDVAARQRPSERRVRGPAAAAAFDAGGNPTQAALGFARSQGVPVESLEITEDSTARRYVVAVQRDAGRAAQDVLPDALVRAVGALTFAKTMRWGTGEMRFARPIRWVAALLGRQVLPVAIARVRAGRITYGHRTLAPGRININEPSRYQSLLRRAMVLVDPQERREVIEAQGRELAAGAGGRAVLDPALVDELVMSVEHPQALRGAFHADYLTLPREVLVTVMQHHQKYFAVEDAGSRLLPVFIAVRDGGAEHLDTVRQGHEWVLAARLADARFFFEEDRKHRLEEHVPRLDHLVFLAQLGTAGEKTRRLLLLARRLTADLRLDAPTAAALERAALLCKADLVTHLVGEFPELQGTIGQIYAGLDGEAAEVARAIGEHYRPASAGDSPPKTRIGALLGLIDKIDTLAGAIDSGLTPSGSQDPLGLRRAAQGIVEIILMLRLVLPLGPFVSRAAEAFAGTERRPGGIAEVVEFLRQRLRASLIERGIRYDIADAALAVSEDDILAASARAEAVAGAVGEARFAALYVGFDRASRIVTGEAAEAVNPALFESDAERTLFEAVREVGGPVRAAAAEGDFRRAMDHLQSLVAPVNRIFDDVLIMAPDPRVRANRLALLREAAATFRVVADFSKIVMTDEQKGVVLGARE
ncbi:MAG TPA: glycine--tRNA ligase subunit beta [bacterium]